MGPFWMPQRFGLTDRSFNIALGNFLVSQLDKNPIYRNPFHARQIGVIKLIVCKCYVNYLIRLSTDSLLFLPPQIDA